MAIGNPLFVCDGYNGIRHFYVFPTFIRWISDNDQEDNAYRWQISQVSVVKRPGFMGDSTLLALSFVNRPPVELDLGEASYQAANVLLSQ